jgi:hypothetical protein
MAGGRLPRLASIRKKRMIPDDQVKNLYELAQISQNRYEKVLRYIAESMHSQENSKLGPSTHIKYAKDKLEKADKRKRQKAKEKEGKTANDTPIREKRERTNSPLPSQQPESPQ